MHIYTLLYSDNYTQLYASSYTVKDTKLQMHGNTILTHTYIIIHMQVYTNCLLNVNELKVHWKKGAQVSPHKSLYFNPTHSPCTPFFSKLWLIYIFHLLLIYSINIIYRPTPLLFAYSSAFVFSTPLLYDPCRRSCLSVVYDVLGSSH